MAQHSSGHTSQSDLLESEFFVLDPRNAFRLMEQISNKYSLFSVLDGVNTLTYTIKKGMTPKGLSGWIGRTSQTKTGQLLERVYQLKDGETILLGATEKAEASLLHRFSYVLQASFNNGEYDIIIVTAEQEIEINRNICTRFSGACVALFMPALACRFSNAILPCGFSNAILPCVVGSTVCAAVSIMTYKDYQKISPSVIYDYILKCMHQRNLLLQAQNNHETDHFV